MDAWFLPMSFLIFNILILPASSTSSTSDGASLSKMMVAWNATFPSWVGGDPCHWVGVVCNNDHRVISLNLSNKGVNGPIPQEISNLQYLTTLDLSNQRNSNLALNQISGDLSALKGLSNLQSLNLTFNNIQLSSFPSVVFSLTNLIALRIDNNKLTGSLPKELAQLTKLQYLYLGNNSLSGPIPVEFKNLINLKELSLWENNLKSKIPPEFGDLINLAYLNLHDCGLYGGLPAELGKLKNIEKIDLYSNQLTGTIPDTWSNLTNLKILILKTNYLTKSLPKWLLSLPSLINMTLDSNYFYGDLPDLTQAVVNNISLTCNFFIGTSPTGMPTQVLQFSGNCFNDFDSNAKAKCNQYPYTTCETFGSVESNEGCPICPQLQVLEDDNTCVCTLAGGGSPKTLKLVSFILGIGGGSLIFLAFLWWMWSRSRKRSVKPSSRYKQYYEEQGPVSEHWEGPEGVVRYKLEDLMRATDNFDSRHEVGAGGFGKVFHAVLQGRQVAIKRAHLSSIQSSSDFRNEVLLLSRLHHKNLVRLLGFCEAVGIQILVYEFVPNGNLHTLLFKSKTTLDWLRRLDIAIGVAQGLEYLHFFVDPAIIHRDVKPSNILLDDNMVAKLSDFGISKIVPELETHLTTRPAGTVGYIDPQYILRECLTMASDVYGFGMVLLELVSGRKAIDNTRLDERNLVQWVKLKLNTEGLECIIDSRLGNRYPKQVYQDIIRLAIDCTSFESQDRPSMKAVVTILDACRWAVSPHLFEVVSNTLDISQEHEDFSATQSIIREGSSNTFSVPVFSPR